MRLYWFIAFSCLYFAESTSQGKLILQIDDMDNAPFQNIEVEIVQLQLKVFTDLKGQCIFPIIPKGVYAVAIDYLYGIEYRTLYMPMSDTSIHVQLERRVAFDEILIRSYQMGITAFPNASDLGGEILQELHKSKDIPYVLAGSPGVLVSSDAGNGVGYTGIRFRGLDPSHIQLTINGIPFTDAESSLSYFVDIPDILSNSERISLIRGNVPNRPGTPSFGGAMDIQTNHLRFTPGARAELQYGSFNTFKFSAGAHSGLLENKYYFEVGLSQMKSDGYIERSASKLNSFYFAAGIVNKKNSFRLNYIHGSEKTGQAWFGLPVQYEFVDSLRRFNAAGMERQTGPYDNEIDDYKQDHLQFFYQQQCADFLTWSNTLNYTHGNGFYENYKAEVDLLPYEINAYGIQKADIIRQKWLSNHYLFLRSELLINPSKSFEFRPEISLSSYDGNHFGRVKDVILDSFEKIKNFYYQNEGTKLDGSLGFKLLWKPGSNWDVNVDILYRQVKHEIIGIKEFNLPLQYELHFKSFTPKLFVSKYFSENGSLFSSIGYMQREPFREDIVVGDLNNTSEELIDFELGMHLNGKKNIKASLNAYYMYYPSLRGLSGELSDVGEPLFINLRKVSNWGLEWTLNLDFGRGDRSFKFKCTFIFQNTKVGGIFP
ncbi:MAG: TonB-dependent receptor plug domain-containing protein [Saprospiraceae bacterium]|nr:TonB-dependent receptor plug domain-containing protein [Saprospiraceae bacterium]